MSTQQDKIRPDKTRPDKTRLALRRLIEEHGVDMAAVSKAIGKNHAYIQQYLTRGVPIELGYRTAMALADYFGCAPDLFGISAGTRAISNDKGNVIRHPLQSIRKLAGLSTADFAKALGEKEKDVAAIEAGQASLNEKMLLKICSTFQIDPADLAGYAPALSPEERVLLLRMRRLTPTQKRKLDVMLAKFEKERA